MRVWVHLAVGALALGAVLACGSPTTRPRAPSTSARSAEARPTPAPCEIPASRSGVLRVAVAGGETLTVVVTDGEVVYRPGSQAETVPVSVRRPIRFLAEAVAPLAGLALREDLDAAGGALRLPAGTRVLSVRRGTVSPMLATVRLGRRSAWTNHWLEAQASPVPLACDAVMPMADRHEPTVGIPLRRPVRSGARIAALGRITLRPLLMAPLRVEVRRRGTEGLLPLWEVDRFHGQSRVVLEFADGARATGWTPTEALRPLSPRETRWLGALLAAPDDAGSSIDDRAIDSELDDALAVAPEPSEGDVVELPAGTVLRVGPGVAWAHVADEPLRVRGAEVRPDGRFYLLEAEGLELAPLQVWVQRDESEPAGSG